MIQPNATVHPLNFSQLSGHDFERLVLAFLWRRWSWTQLDWYGQLGDDDGRDIVGHRENDYGELKLVVFACANWQRLTLKKAKEDTGKIVSGPHGLPYQLILISGGKVSASLKTKAVGYGKTVGIQEVEVWSGPEFEEMLRLHAESVLRRFLGGEVFPDEPLALREFVATTPSSEEEALRFFGRLLDRPAFITPFHMESSLPEFRRAISDTIEAINTGIYRSRDSTIIRRLLSRYDFTNRDYKRQLSDIVTELNGLRMAFDTYMKSGMIKPCGCGDPKCSIFICEQVAVEDMNGIRRRLMHTATSVIPDFHVFVPY
jgi:hypothetical protein